MSQVALASEWLGSLDPQQRLDGAEQLSAYPTRSAEVLLIKALVTDTDPEVRVAAAQSLNAFEHLQDTAIIVLLAAVEDENEDVQLSALNTLESLVANEQNGSARYKKIMTRLKKKAKSSRLSQETRAAVRGFIEDQAVVWREKPE